MSCNFFTQEKKKDRIWLIKKLSIFLCSFKHFTTNVNDVNTSPIIDFVQNNNFVLSTE